MSWPGQGQDAGHTAPEGRGSGPARLLPSPGTPRGQRERPQTGATPGWKHPRSRPHEALRSLMGPGEASLSGGPRPPPQGRSRL